MNKIYGLNIDALRPRSSNISSVIWTYKMGSGTTITVNFAVNVLLGQCLSQSKKLGNIKASVTV